MPDSVWRYVREVDPPGAGPYLLRPDSSALPRVGVRAPGLRGCWRVSFPPLEGAVPGLRGIFLEPDAVASWQWAEIPS